MSEYLSNLREKVKNCKYYNEESIICFVRPFCMKTIKFPTIAHIDNFSKRYIKGIRCPCKMKIEKYEK